MKAIILDYGRGVRKLDPNESYPYSLSQINGHKAVEWNIRALKSCGIDEIIFVCGYHIEKLIAKYPQYKFYYLLNWEQSSLGKVFEVIQDESDTAFIIFSGETVFRQSALEKLLSGRESLRFGYRNESEQDPILAYIEAQRWSFFQDAVEKFPTKTLSEALIHIKELCEKIDLDDQAVSLNSPFELTQFILGSKAQTLQRLKPLLKRSMILSQISFSTNRWKTAQKEIIDQVQQTFESQQIIVRSSSVNEDGWESSAAGHYTSILNISRGDSCAIEQAVNDVICSYGDECSSNEVLIQPQVENIALSGVTFTRDINHNAPYYVINYEFGDTTDGITSGESKSHEKMILRRDFQGPFDYFWTAPFLEAVKEIETLLNYDSLDIEFAVSKKGQIFIFQVRPLVACANQKINDCDFFKEHQNIQSFCEWLSQGRQPVLGDGLLLGNMPDWNPAEIIGTHPGSLALSLYKKIITDDIWNKARQKSAYKKLPNEPLLYSLCHQPYIDIRASLTSFLPENLSDRVAEKLIRYQCEKLRDNPEFHDKIEFNIALTCSSFDLEKRLEELVQNGFLPDEIEELRRELRHLTCQCILNRKTSIQAQLSELDQMISQRERMKKALKCENPTHIIKELQQLIENTKRYGTRPFSILARYAFISMSFLRSMADDFFPSENDLDNFLSSISTVATEVSMDLGGLKKNHSGYQSIVEKYGHLRPDTYDITSLSYAEAPELYFGSNKIDLSQSQNCPRSYLLDRQKLLQQKLKDQKLEIPAKNFIDFICDSIVAREFAKFEFTKNLSLILDSIKVAGEHFKIDRDDMAFISIENLLKWSSQSLPSTFVVDLKREINHMKKRLHLSRAIHLPSFISSNRDLHYFIVRDSEPNFITNKKIQSSILYLDENKRFSKKQINDCIIVISRADPGFDWIFSHNIKGLITQYGGIASHMAIRAAEFKLPAAIGCGENIFERLIKAQKVCLDCGNKQIKILS